MRLSLLFLSKQALLGDVLVLSFLATVVDGRPAGPRAQKKNIGCASLKLFLLFGGIFGKIADKLSESEKTLCKTFLKDAPQLKNEGC